MLQTILIGSPAPLPQQRQIGIAPFIRSILDYPALLLRLAIAAGLWRAFAWLGWTFPAALGFLAFEIYGSLVVLRILADLFAWRQSGRILGAMWLPAAVVAVAVYLFFFNDQGRELGFGLMDPSIKGLYLAIALVYWAVNNWLSARIGLTRNFPEPANDQVLLFWGPRLLGVCAHLVAACSLSVAAWKQPDLQGPQGLWLVLAAPLAIVLATIFAWLYDKGYPSERYQPAEKERARAWARVVGSVGFLLLCGLASAAFGNEQRGLSIAALFIAGSALFFLILMSRLRREAPIGPNVTHEQRRQDREREQHITTRWTLSLALIMILATAAIWTWPMHVGEIAGSLTVACFAFGAFLALVNLLDLFVVVLTDYATSRRIFVRQRTVWLTLNGFILASAFLASLSHSFHRVRLCEANLCTPVATAGWAAIEKPDQRPSISDAASAWYKQAEPAYHALHPNEPVPMLIVATAGGGIRAAYWTATVMEAIEAEFQPKAAAGNPSDEIALAKKSLLRNLLFAISGVSGGSVGAATYAASVHDLEVHDKPIAPTAYLQNDFLAPGLASMVFIDGPGNVLPDFGQIDRGEALELGFEAASLADGDRAGLLSHSFLSFFPTMEAVSKMHSWRPALLLNATHEETGRRIIASHIKIERGVVFDSYDALQVLNSDIRLSTAAHNSARFTYISPAGNLSSATEPTHNRGYVIDGGYFENYGAQTALELANAAIEAIDPNHQKVKLVILQISSDPTLQKDRTLVRVDGQGSDCVVSSFEPQPNKSNPADPANYLELIDPKWRHKNEGEGYVLPGENELSAPFVGIMSVREAHGTIAAEELASASCPGHGKQRTAQKNQPLVNVAAGTTGTAKPQDSQGLPHFAHFALCSFTEDGKPDINPPLGWVLSKPTRDRFKDFLRHCGNEAEREGLKIALGLTP
jgi:hypothetical protein